MNTNELKEKLAGVSCETLAAFGAALETGADADMLEAIEAASEAERAALANMVEAVLESERREHAANVTLARQLAGVLHVICDYLMGDTTLPGESLDVIGCIVAGAADLLDEAVKRAGAAT